MSIAGYLTAAFAGYLLGSVSFAHLLTQDTKRPVAAEGFTLQVPNSSATLVSTSESATAVRMRSGAASGCLVGILDMAKGALPAWLLHLWYPNTQFYLVFATLAVVGHIWPLYHRFRGGRGQSVIVGSMLAIDPLGVLLMNVAGFLLGVALNNLLVIMAGGMLLMIPWLLIRTGDLAQIAYTVVANALYWYAMRSELRQYSALRRVGHLTDRTELFAFMGMPRLDRLTNSWLDRLRSRCAGPSQPHEDEERGQ